jgi:cell division protein FtsI/penicillin-binding protein 2
MVRKFSNSDIFHKRTTVMTVVLFGVFAIILYKFFSLQILNGKETRKQAEGQHIVVKKLFPSRGEIRILDPGSVEGYIVATNIKKFFVYAVPSKIVNVKLAAPALASTLGLKDTEVLEKISNKQKKYVILKKQLTKEEQDKLLQLKLDGLYLDTEEARYYPEKTFLSQTLGFVGYKGDTKQGLYGLEKEFEKELAGKQGLLNEEKDMSGTWIFGGKRDIDPAQNGVNLILTIDKSIQFKVESVLKDAVTKHGADSGAIGIINPKTGAILALAGYPNFDPNEYNKEKNPAVYRNEAVVENYEPGSIFKALTMASAINEGKVGPETTYTDTGNIAIDGYNIKNSDKKANGVQNMVQVLEKSLNTGVIFAKEQIGNKKFYEYVRKFGFGEFTGVELPETKGDLGGLAGNVGVNYHNASFGQGISVTVLQMLKAYTALANEGKMMKPYLVQSKIYENGKVENTESKVERQVITSKTASTITSMLVQVVENGHGKKAGVPGYFIAGKTGTAQVASSKGGYEANNNIGSFIGYGPAENPQFLMLVRIDHPRDVTYAEVTAAPAFGEIAQFILNYMRVPPSR